MSFAFKKIMSSVAIMLTKLQKGLTEKLAILITNPYNIEYLAGVKGQSYKEREYMLVITSKSAFLITARMFKKEAEESRIISSGKAELVLLKEREGFFETVKKLLPFEVKKLFVEEYDLKLLEYLHLKKLIFPVRIKHLKNKVLDLRVKKDLTEIKLLQKAQELTAKVLKKTIEYLKANFEKGVSERELASFIVSETLKIEDAALSFEPIVASGEGSAVPHYKPRDKKIEKGVLLIDLGVRYKGYCGDLTRTFYLGEPDKEFLEYYKLVNEALDKAIDKARSKVEFLEVHKAAVEIFEKKGVKDKFLHGIGHGVGLEIHERPFVRGGKRKEILEKNTVITIEPGLYFEGKYGVRIEEMVWVKKNTSIVFKVMGRRVEDVVINPKHQAPNPKSQISTKHQ